MHVHHRVKLHLTPEEAKALMTKLQHSIFLPGDPATDLLQNVVYKLHNEGVE